MTLNKVLYLVGEAMRLAMSSVSYHLEVSLLLGVPHGWLWRRVVNTHHGDSSPRSTSPTWSGESRHCSLHRPA